MRAGFRPATHRSRTLPLRLPRQMSRTSDQTFGRHVAQSIRAFFPRLRKSLPPIPPTRQAAESYLLRDFSARRDAANYESRKVALVIGRYPNRDHPFHILRRVIRVGSRSERKKIMLSFQMRRLAPLIWTDYWKASNVVKWVSALSKDVSENRARSLISLTKSHKSALAISRLLENNARLSLQPRRRISAVYRSDTSRLPRDSTITATTATAAATAATTTTAAATTKAGSRRRSLIFLSDRAIPLPFSVSPLPRTRNWVDPEGPPLRPPGFPGGPRAAGFTARLVASVKRAAVVLDASSPPETDLYAQRYRSPTSAPTTATKIVLLNALSNFARGRDLVGIFFRLSESRCFVAIFVISEASSVAIEHVGVANFKAEGWMRQG